MSETGGLKSFGQGRRDILMIDPRQINIEDGFNARDFSTPENQEHVEWLKGSIKLEGVKEPLTVRMKDGKVYLVNGESRLRATLKAIEEGCEIKSVPCQSDDRHANDADRVVELVTRNSGKPLTPLEKANVVKRLLSFGWEQHQIAERLNYSDSYISYLLKLLSVPEEAQEMIRNGEVSASAAVEAVTSAGEADGVAYLREAADEAKSAGKTKATTGRVRKTVARGALAKGGSKKSGMTLNAVKTEKVLKFMRWIGSKAENIREVREEAAKVSKEILGD